MKMLSVQRARISFSGLLFIINQKTLVWSLRYDPTHHRSKDSAQNPEQQSENAREGLEEGDIDVSQVTMF